MLKRSIAVPCFLIAVLVACRPAPVVPQPHVPLAHYEIRADIDPASGFLEAAVELTLEAPAGEPRSLTFLLHREFEIRRVAGEGVAGHGFGPPPDRPSLYSPEAFHLRVDFETPPRAGDTLRIAFEYAGEITSWPEWSANVMTGEWVELGLYFPWFPHREEMGMFTYRLDIGCPENHEARAAVPVRNEGGRRIFDERRPSRDIVLVVSPHLKTRSFDLDGADIHIHAVSLTAETIEMMGDDLSAILGLFRSWFGDLESAALTVIQSPRVKGGGYARNNLVVLGGLQDRDYAGQREGYIRYLAHEAAHNWWWRAPVDTWEDWLNEGLAEFSALAVVRDMFGVEAFEKRLARKKEAAAGEGAIPGFDRADLSSPEARRTSEILLYSKAPVLLFELEDRLGVDGMREFCRLLVRDAISTTDGFLETLARYAGGAERERFEARLTSVD